MIVATFFSSLAVLVGCFVVLKSKAFGASSAAIFSVFVKISLCFLGLIFILPFGGVDAVTFEQVAWEWSRGSLWDTIATIDVTRSYFISSITAILYNIFERNIAIPVFINGMLGMLIFYYGLVLARSVWGENRINPVFSLILALHPMLNIHSAIMLRENYIVFFALLAAIQLAKFAHSGRGFHVWFFLLNVLLASFFHGGMVLMAAGLPMFVLFGAGGTRRINKIVFGIIFTVLGLGIMSTMEFGKLKDLQSGEVFESGYLEQLEGRRQEASTAYLQGLKPETPVDLLWQAPLRTLYFLAKPFPWDVKSFGHALVLLDAVLWWLILYLLLRHWSRVRRNPAAFALILSCLLALIAFSYGVSNFGTGVRHRTKFLVMALVIVYPFLPRIKFSSRSHALNATKRPLNMSKSLR